MSRINLLIVSMLAPFCLMDLQAEDVPKLVKKDIAQLFGESSSIEKLEKQEYQVLPDSLAKEGEEIYRISGAEGQSGILLLTWAMGRFEAFDYAILSSDKPEILSVRMIQYRSSHGASVGSRSWLKQFQGYNGEVLKLGKNVDHLSGATISAESLLKDLQRAYDLLIVLSSF